LGEIIPQQSSDDDIVERTRLSIALAGTMIYGERNSFAFISKQDSLNKYVIYGIDECFHAKTILRDNECNEESVKVLEIKDRWVLISHKGVKQALWMISTKNQTKKAEDFDKSKKSFELRDPPDATTNLVVPRQENNISEKSITKESHSEQGNTFHFQRVWVDEQLANFEQLLNDARVIPTTKGKKPYFMFQYIKKESIYEKLGLKKNDIILEINGFIVDSVGKALKLLEVLQSEREISLKVERDGKAVGFHYYID